MTKLICTKETPAPKGEPIFPGAVAAHVARPDWGHPDIEEGEVVSSGGRTPFRPIKLRNCKNCGGSLP